jgi:hypothetical protein
VESDLLEANRNGSTRSSEGSGRDRVLRPITGAVLDNLPVLAVLAPFALLAVLVDTGSGVAVADRLYRTSPTALMRWAVPLAILASLPSIAWFALARIRARRAAGRSPDAGPLPSLPRAWADFEPRPTVRRFLRLLVCLMALGVFFQVFSGFKGAIPVFHPFRWDEAFMRLDRAIHFGYDPWRLLHPILGQPTLTRILDFMYYVWFPVNLGMLLWFGWMRDGPHRRRFFLSYMLTWILLGNLAALAFSSAGPCYFDLVTGSLGPFEALMAYLRQVDMDHGLITMDIQAILLDGYSPTEVNPVQGIAAMPSLHVAMPFLMALAVHSYSRVAGGLFVAFGIVILLGSVHLAWHYAVDGYAAILAVPFIWWAVGRVTGSGTAPACHTHANSASQGDE